MLGDTGPDVRIVRRKLGFDPDGSYDQQVMEIIRVMNGNGEVDSTVAKRLGEAASVAAGLMPEWYRRKLELWHEGEDVRTVRGLLGLGTRDNRFDPDAESAVRRLQSAAGAPVTGQVDEETARLLGEA